MVYLVNSIFSLNLHFFKSINTISVISFNYQRVFSFFKSMTSQCIIQLINFSSVQKALQQSSLYIIGLFYHFHLWCLFAYDFGHRCRQTPISEGTHGHSKAGAAEGELPFLCQFREIPGLVVSGIMQIVNDTECQWAGVGLRLSQKPCLQEKVLQSFFFAST